MINLYKKREGINMEPRVKQDTVNMWLLANQKYFPNDRIPFIKNKLEELPQSKFNLLYAAEFKDPTTILLISIFLGYLGIDRFMIGDTGLGILKLLTFGVCGIMTIIDWFLISDRTKEMNFSKFMSVI